MQGQILEATAAKSGTILGDDGNRYAFSAADWRAGDGPAAGMRVDFVPGEGSLAREIFPLPGASAAPPSYAASSSVPPPQSYPPRPPANNSQLLGWLGIGCLLLGFIIPIILPTIAAFILGLIAADSGKRHNDSTGLVLGRIAWIGSVVTFALGIFLLVFAFAFVWPFFAAIIDAAMEAERSGQGTNALIAFLFG